MAAELHGADVSTPTRSAPFPLSPVAKAPCARSSPHSKNLTTKFHPHAKLKLTPQRA